MENKKGWLAVASLPAIQRDLFLSRAVRRQEDGPSRVGTLEVEWKDMVVEFASSEAISIATVTLDEAISLPVFTRRMESLLDCGSKAEAAVEWVMKFACRISAYGTPEKVRQLLCDKVASLDSSTGETVGVLKIKRRAVGAGHAKVRLVPAEDSLQVVCRHGSAQGLKAVWKSVLWRLRPQYAGKVATEANGTELVQVNVAGHTVTVPPCINVQADTYYWSNYAPEVSRLGGVLDVAKAQKEGINVSFPLTANSLMGFGQWSGSYWQSQSNSGRYVATVRIGRIPAGGIPKGLSVGSTGEVSVSSEKYTEFRQLAETLSQWLGLDWNLPPVPANSNEFKPTK